MELTGLDPEEITEARNQAMRPTAGLFMVTAPDFYSLL